MHHKTVRDHTHSNTGAELAATHLNIIYSIRVRIGLQNAAAVADLTEPVLIDDDTA